MKCFTDNNKITINSQNRFSYIDAYLVDCSHLIAFMIVTFCVTFNCSLISNYKIKIVAIKFSSLFCVALPLLTQRHLL